MERQGLIDGQCHHRCPITEGLFDGTHVQASDPCMRDHAFDLASRLADYDEGDALRCSAELGRDRLLDLLSSFGDFGIPRQEFYLSNRAWRAPADQKRVAVLSFELVEMASGDAKVKLCHRLREARRARGLIEHLAQTEEVSCIDDGVALITPSDDFYGSPMEAFLEAVGSADICHASHSIHQGRRTSHADSFPSMQACSTNKAIACPNDCWPDRRSAEDLCAPHSPSQGRVVRLLLVSPERAGEALAPPAAFCSIKIRILPD